ncbi:MAG: hypothetical protein C0510_00190 [Erythrobacter sp.]|nr:hypothetical protein [Erythrobacter sp.]MBA4163043.1 hypothetical protein [Erythrobacter sp.]
MHYAVQVSVFKNGDLRPKIEVTVNGKRRNWNIPRCSNHVAYYLAVLSCLTDAIANGASSVTVEIGDQTARRQLNGQEMPRQKHTIALHEAVRVAASALNGTFVVI